MYKSWNKAIWTSILIMYVRANICTWEGRDVQTIIGSSGSYWQNAPCSD
jgi:hypothetical protein